MMLQHFLILVIKILVLEFVVSKANAVSSEDFLQPPSDVRLISIDTSTLRLIWGPPNTTNETLTGYNITWEGNGAFVGNSSTAFNITNLPIPGRNYTASISAYYATQQNSAYINVSKNTYPSPAFTFSVVSRQTNRFDLQWTNSGVYTSCFVWADQTPSATTSCSTGTAVVDNLPTAGKEYTIYIVIQSGQLNSTNYNIIERTNPSPASNITVVSRQTNRFDLQWTNYGESTVCFVWVDQTPSAGTSCSTGSKTAFIVNLPTAGKVYTIYIVIQSGQLNSTNSNITDRTNPLPASGFTVVSRQTNRFDLQWTNTGQSTNCYVWAEQAANATTSCFTGNKTAVITNLPTAGKQYTIYIVIQSGQLNSTDSNITDRTNPLPASTFSVASRQTNRFDLQWTNSGVYTNCVVWAEQTPSAGTSCSTGSRTAVIDNLPTAGRVYTIHIVIQSGQLNSTNSNITDRTSPPNPGSLYCSSRTTTSLTIGIGFPSGSSYELDGYLFSISSKVPLFSYSVNRTVNANTTQPNVTFIATNMMAGVTYSINARTTIKNLFSSGQGITECTTDLNAPGNVRINNTSEMTVQIIWDAPQGNFDGFRAFCDGQNQAKDVNSVLYRSPGSGNTFNTVCNGMTAGALYNVSVSTFLNQTNLTSMKSSNLVWTVTVPLSPKNVTASPIDTNSIQMQLLYGYNVDVSQCTSYKIMYSNRTDFIACGATSVNYSLPSLQSDSLYNINTYALSNYSASLSSISRIPVQTPAWTLAPPVTNITGHEGLLWSLEVIIGHHPFPKNVWQYVICVTNSTHLVQRVQIACSDANMMSLTAVNCAWNDAVSVLNSTATCSDGFSYNITELRPYTNYNISVQAVNPGGCSQAKSIVLSTNESSPSEPRLTATPLSPYSALINWTLSVDKKTGPETYYNLTLIDIRDPTFIIYAHIAGFYNRSWEFSGLDAYWNYSVAIVAYIIDEYGQELATEGAEVVYLQTLESSLYNLTQ